MAARFHGPRSRARSAQYASRGEASWLERAHATSKVLGFQAQVLRSEANALAGALLRLGDCSLGPPCPAVHVLVLALILGVGLHSRSWAWSQEASVLARREQVVARPDLALSPQVRANGGGCG